MTELQLFDKLLRILKKLYAVHQITKQKIVLVYEGFQETVSSRGDCFIVASSTKRMLITNSEMKKINEIEMRTQAMLRFMEIL